MPTRHINTGIVLALGASIWSNGIVAHSHGSPDPGAGKAIYEQTCVACHGKDGRGELPGVPDLTKSAGPLAKPKADLVHNVMEGYQSSGSLMAMPAKGGNPSLSETDVRKVVEYLLKEFGSEDINNAAGD